MLRTTNWLKFISRNESCPFMNKVITFFWRGRTINETSALQEWGEHCDLFQRLNLNHFPSWFQIETSTLTSQSNHTLCVESAHLIWNAAFRLFSWFDLHWFWLALSYNAKTSHYSDFWKTKLTRKGTCSCSHKVQPSCRPSIKLKNYREIPLLGGRDLELTSEEK